MFSFLVTSGTSATSARADKKRPMDRWADPDHDFRDPNMDLPTAPTVLQDVASMIDFALQNPDTSQVPLAYRDSISQPDWESFTDAERARYQAQHEDAVS